MKRFITYLYEYEGGQKTKNTGFVRVDERNRKVDFLINIHTCYSVPEKVQVYAFVWKTGWRSVLLGEVGAGGSLQDIRLEADAENIMDSGVTLEEVVGIGIFFDDEAYMASCWRDEYAKEIAEAQNPEQTEEGVPQEDIVAESVAQEYKEATNTYQKMELNAIRNLPSSNWYLCNNRFLVHGFFNYGYLLCKTVQEGEMEKTYLGVPGVYEKPERVMATLFGFTDFEMLPKEISLAKMGEIVPAQDEKETSEPETGAFGCWLIPIQR